MATQSQFSTMLGLVVVVVSGLLSITAVTAIRTHSVMLDLEVGALQQHTSNFVEVLKSGGFLPSVGNILHSEEQVIIVVDIVVDTISGQANRLASTAITGLQPARRLLVSNGQAAAQTEDKPADDENCMSGVCPSDAKAQTPLANTNWAPGDPNCIFGFC